MTQQQIASLQSVLTNAHNQYYNDLRRYSVYKLSNNALSEDLVQETFLKTWKYLVEGGKIQAMRSFLYHIINNLIIDQYRKHKTVSLDALVEDGFEIGSDEQARIFNQHDGDTALLMVSRLPAKYRKIIYMRYKQSLSLKEMSEATGQSRNAVAVQVCRGMKKLKSLYSHSQSSKKAPAMGRQ